MKSDFISAAHALHPPAENAQCAMHAVAMPVTAKTGARSINAARNGEGVAWA
ncbi:hypothetical protein [Stenotrophomonas maltophilia]|uniref:hypothetical protein n=1 Tax=Stenotrophomonas maltophilia TaxID=40324 RepID=UPI0016559D89|nr:hypothetical protein [Stenotrophomonas maltophilia]MBC8772543.1 hypothetical protein [Stenotrophomonas maltophilia]